MRNLADIAEDSTGIVFMDELRESVRSIDDRLRNIETAVVQLKQYDLNTEKLWEKTMEPFMAKLEHIDQIAVKLSSKMDNQTIEIVDLGHQKNQIENTLQEVNEKFKDHEARLRKIESKIIYGLGFIAAIGAIGAIVSWVLQTI